jgi:hypothetical protein
MLKKIDMTTGEQTSNTTYVGALPDMSMQARLSLGPPNRGYIPSIGLFLAKYQAYPCTLDCETEVDDAHFHTTTILNYLRDKLKHDITKDCTTQKYYQRTKQMYIDGRVSDLGNGIMIVMTLTRFDSDLQNPNKLQVDYSDDYFLTTPLLSIHYLPEHDVFVQDLARIFSKMTVFSSKSCSLQMVCRNQQGYYLSAIKIKKPLITDLALHYGPKFVSVHDKIIKNLNTKESKGIVLLHGIPGSGDYSFFRSIMMFFD